MIGNVLVLFMAGLSLSASSDMIYNTKNYHLSSGEMATIESFNYPNTAPGNLRQSWMFKTTPDSVISFSCNDIRLYQGDPCREYALVVSEPGKVEEVCGAVFHYNRVSSGNHLGISLRTGPMGRGYVRCRAIAIPKEEALAVTESPEKSKFTNLTFSSEELDDSSEYGGPKGRKPTTCNCGWTNKKLGRIFGGKEAHVNEFPFMAGIVRHGMKSIFCGSSIITAYHAVTAANCLYGRDNNGPFDIVVGEHDLQRVAESDATEYIPIKKYIIHEGYNKNTYLNDIALIVLDKAITFSKKVGPVCLPKAPMDLEEEFVKVIGWGRNPEKKMGAPVLQKVDLKVLSKSFCAEFKPKMVPPGSPNQICTYGKGKSSCSGDSGGPLIWIDRQTNRYTLIGIVSYRTKECGKWNLPQVSTDFTTYLDWIQEKIKENGPEAQTCSKA